MLATVCLPCSDGVGRTGVFITVHTQLERLKTEGVVNVFQSLKSARIRIEGSTCGHSGKQNQASLISSESYVHNRNSTVSAVNAAYDKRRL